MQPLGLSWNARCEMNGCWLEQKLRNAALEPDKSKLNRSQPGHDYVAPKLHFSQGSKIGTNINMCTTDARRQA